MLKNSEFVKKGKYFPKKVYLNLFLKKFWFIPSDVFQRSIEGGIWDYCNFKRPILDIGIGNGAITPLIFKNIDKIDVGIDIEESGLAQAEQSGMYKKVLRDDAEKMSFKNSTFNTIISNSTFEHIKNDVRAVSEVSRVLKKNGLFFLTVPCTFLPNWILEYEGSKKEAKIAKKNLSDFNKRVQHYHYRSISDWRKIFKNNGIILEFYKFYYSKETVIFWYKIFKLFTKRFAGKELWSIIGFSKYAKLLPKDVLIKIEKQILEKKFEKAFFTDNEEGGMLFMVARKK